MIGEKRFAHTHLGFWKALLPMEEPYLRAHNRRLETIGNPVFTYTIPAERGFVNEASFLLFVRATELGLSPEHVPNGVVLECVEHAVGYISRLQQTSPQQSILPDWRHSREVVSLALNLYNFFGSESPTGIEPKPRFPGCGWIDAAEGDVYAALTLYEIKAGERLFGVSDLRQVLCYAALATAAQSHEINSICLVNPRSGVALRDSIEMLCQKVSGVSAAEVLGEIVSYISEPMGRYGGH